MEGSCESGNESSVSIKKVCNHLTTWVTIFFSRTLIHGVM
jgi:hypothetical protein